MSADSPIQLYPLKFKPLFRKKPWGGYRLKAEFGYGNIPAGLVGEAWLLSAVPGSETVVDNGPLKGNTLSEVYEVFLDELVGELVVEAHPKQFPLLIKILDANEWLSIQVHPDDELALERHGTTGKTEMWYILDAVPGAKLISGFDRELDRNALVFITENKLLPEVVHYEEVHKGELFYTPAGRIHAIGPGILLAEIQQSSDTTYRLFDWGRNGEDGKPRETHLSLALDAIDYDVVEVARTPFEKHPNQSNPMVDEEHFTTRLICCDTPVKNDYSLFDSFVILLFTQGEGSLISGNFVLPYQKGEIILLPATTTHVELLPAKPTEALEIRMEL